jgi:hypothetical protein
MNSEPVSIKTLMMPLKTATATNVLRHDFNSSKTGDREHSIACQVHVRIDWGVERDKA